LQKKGGTQGQKPPVVGGGANFRAAGRRNTRKRKKWARDGKEKASKGEGGGAVKLPGGEAGLSKEGSLPILPGRDQKGEKWGKGVQIAFGSLKKE